VAWVTLHFGCWRTPIAAARVEQLVKIERGLIEREPAV